MRRLLALVTLALAACNSSASVSPDPTPPAPPAPLAPVAKTEAFGEPLSPAAERVVLTDLVKTPSRWADKTVHVEGKVTAVCQNKGCWLEIGDETGSAHVKLGGHKFFVPRSASGRQAAVEARVLPQVDKGHCEQEAEEQTGKVAKVELFATGVELF